MTTATYSEKDKQHELMLKRAKEFEGNDNGMSVVVANALVTGMRDIGYKSTPYAINEIIDNSIESGASAIFVEFLEVKKKVEEIAIIDNGWGMPEKWVRHALRLGASSRDQENLTGIGRYGFGLKTAGISFARRIEVYSRTEDDKYWTMAYLDIDELAAGTYLEESGKMGVPPSVNVELPQWVETRLDERKASAEHGTIVVLKNIEAKRVRIGDKKTATDSYAKFQPALLDNFGVTYRNFLREISILVNGEKVIATDPLFLTPGFRFFDEDSDRAKALPEALIEVQVKGQKGKTGTIRARYSVMPPTFLRRSEFKKHPNPGPRTTNKRFQVKKHQNGIFVLRSGRQMDVVSSRCPWTKFQNNDRFIGVELDFDPILDEEFSVTTSKQQVTLSERLWGILEEAGVYEAIQNARKEFKKLHDAHGEKLKQEVVSPAPADEGPKMTPSEKAMLQAEKHEHPKPTSVTNETQKRADEKLDEAVTKEASDRQVPEPQVRKEIEKRIKAQPYKISHESNGDLAPFFRAEQMGGQKVLHINKDHAFYSRLYSKIPLMDRFGLDVLLFSIAKCYISSGNETKKFYESESVEWSKVLKNALEDLSKWDGSDEQNRVMEEMANYGIT